MPKIITFLVLFIVVITIATYVAGYTSEPEWSGVRTSVYDEKVHNMFDIVTNENQIKVRKKDIQIVDVTAFNNGLIEWTEFLKDGRYRKYKTIEKSTPDRVAIELVESSNGVTGIWEYTLKEREGGTEITIEEQSSNPNLWSRGIDVLRGRDYRLRREILSIHYGLVKYLVHEK